LEEDDEEGLEAKEEEISDSESTSEVVDGENEGDHNEEGDEHIDEDVEDGDVDGGFGVESFSEVFNHVHETVLIEEVHEEGIEEEEGS
jgi:hypothetical protein